MPKFTPKMKLALDPSYYPPNYIPTQEEDSTPSLVNNLVTPPDKLEDQERNNGTKTRMERGQKKKKNMEENTQQRHS